VDKTFKTEELNSFSRRDFFKKTASVSAVAAAAILSPGALFADDENIIHHTQWGTTLGNELNEIPMDCRQNMSTML